MLKMGLLLRCRDSVGCSKSCGCAEGWFPVHCTPFMTYDSISGRWTSVIKYQLYTDILPWIYIYIYVYQNTSRCQGENWFPFLTPLICGIISRFLRDHRISLHRAPIHCAGLCRLSAMGVWRTSLSWVEANLAMKLAWSMDDPWINGSDSDCLYKTTCIYYIHILRYYIYIYSFTWMIMSQ